MKAKFAGLAVAALLAVSAFGATSASAATEFGDSCVASVATFEPPVTYFEISTPGNPLPTAAPVGGVITQWKSNLVPVPVSIPQTLKVLRQNGPATVLIVGESTGNITGGANAFNTRIPVQAGDRIGLFGETGMYGNLICPTPGVENVIGGFLGGGSVGATSPFEQASQEFRVPTSAVIEADADNDGFGDETQDKCPQVASVQTECPVVAVDASTVIKRKGSVVVLLTVNSAAPVKVTGVVNLGKGKKVKLGSKTQTVTPGKVSRFTLKFPKKLKERLEELTRKQSLRLKLTASATDLIGRVTTDKLKTRLKGQGEG